MNIYISLPITGRPLPEAVNHADTVKSYLSKKGHVATSPFDIYAGDKPEWEDYMLADLRELLKSDAVCFCKGWESSPGCRLEMDAVREANVHRLITDEGKQIEIWYEDEPRTWR